MSLLLPLPETAESFGSIEWSEVSSWYDRLDALPTEHPDAWLRTWSHFEALLREASSRAMIAYTCATDDTAAAEAHRRFSTEIGPKADERATALARKALTLGIDDPDMAFALRRFQAAIEVFREANVPLVAEVEALGTDYQRVTGGMTVEWEGKSLPIPRLSPFLFDPDREVRERAWRVGVGPFVTQREPLNGIFDRMRALREAIARNASFASYRDYAFRAKARFDYGPEDCLAFHETVADVVLPVLARLRDNRRRRLGLDHLRPWDLGANPYCPTPIRPYREPGDLPRIAARIFHRVDPHLGREFEQMDREGLLDLESRPGKAPGGYCDTLPVARRPFIFMNAAGTMVDVMTLFHEAGHAFHAFAASGYPIVWQRQPGAEAAELASMAMELLAGRFLGPPEGYLSADEAAAAMMDHVEDAVTALAHVAAVDAFQHWVYTDPAGTDHEQRDLRWQALKTRFDPGVDWTGLDAELATRWHRQLHIFLHPFYYIEYGFAQIGAFQLWQQSLEDHPSAVERYRSFLALGATRSLPDLYRAAGVEFVARPDTLAEVMAFVEGQLEGWWATLPDP